MEGFFTFKEYINVMVQELLCLRGGLPSSTPDGWWTLLSTGRNLVAVPMGKGDREEVGGRRKKERERDPFKHSKQKPQVVSCDSCTARGWTFNPTIL